MNTMVQARSAYTDPNHSVRTPRGIEYQAFANATRRLSAAQRDEKTPFSDLAQAVYANERLWITLAADLAKDDNMLPSQLRAQLFYLAEFTGQHSRKVLRKEADLQILIDINTAIMRGLRGDGDPGR